MRTFLLRSIGDGAARLAGLMAPPPLLAVAALLLGGCAGAPEWLGPVAVETRHAPVNHLGEVRLPPDLRRVALLPVWTGGLIVPEARAEFDRTFADALQAGMRFEVVPVSRDWCRQRFGVEEFSSSAALPHDLLAKVAAEHGADGVVFVDLTSYRDLRPLAIGVRAKLATAPEPRLVWSYDELLSAADPGVANSAKADARTRRASDLPVDLSASVLQSPSRFAAYVAATAFGTLPPR